MTARHAFGIAAWGATAWALGTLWVWPDPFWPIVTVVTTAFLGLALFWDILGE